MTIPFDLEAFKKGAVAISDAGQEVRFSNVTAKGFIFSEDGYTIDPDFVSKGISVANSWTMKEPTIKESQWIPHDGGPCPIPWARAKEYEVRGRNGQVVLAQVPATVASIWLHLFGEADVIAYRLTDGWIPVLNGVCPIDAQRGTFEVKRSNGLVKCIDCNIYKTTVFYNGPEVYVVAVRLIDKKQMLSSFVNNPEHWNVDTSSGQDVSVEAEIVNGKIVRMETSQQRLTRELSTKYFEKHFKTVEPVKSLGEEEMSRIAGLALEQHDKVWPRKLECSECCGEGWVVQYSKNGIHRFEECSDCRNPHHCGRPG